MGLDTGRAGGRKEGGLSGGAQRAVSSWAVSGGRVGVVRLALPVRNFSRLWRLCLIVWLALAVPLQGWAGAAMWHLPGSGSGAEHGVVQAQAGEAPASGDLTAADEHAGCHSPHGAHHDTTAHASLSAEPAPAEDSSHTGQHRCSACVWCAACGLPMAHFAGAAGLPSPAASAEAFAPVQAPSTRWVSNGLERPPKPSRP